MTYTLLGNPGRRRVTLSNRVAVGIAGFVWLAMLAGEIAETSSSMPSVDAELQILMTAEGRVAANATQYAAAGSSETSREPIIATIITNPGDMFRFYGFVAPPLLVLSVKGIFNFTVQITLYLGSAVWRASRQDLRDMLNKTDALRFSKISIGFQILGQASAAISYLKLALATKPWRGSEGMCMFFYLVSQHSSSISLLVGLANNTVLAFFMKGDNVMVAKTLVVTGLIIGTPIWGALFITCWPLGYVVFAVSVCLSFSMCYLLVVILEQRRGNACVSIAEFRRGLLDAPEQSILGVSMFMPMGLSIVWVGIAGLQIHAMLFVAATLLEFVIPMLVLLFLAMSIVQGRDAYLAQMLTTFCIAMGAVYTVAMIIPAAILANQPNYGIAEAAPEVFWGKKIVPFLGYTFLLPAQHIFQEVGDNAYLRTFHIWLVTLFSYFA